MMVSFGNASGAVDSFSPGILSAKGSLFLTRPTLMAYCGTRLELLESATEVFEVIASGAVKIEKATGLSASGCGPGAQGPGSA